jgi:arylsulfatase A-like enzyme
VAGKQVKIADLKGRLSEAARPSPASASVDRRRTATVKPARTPHSTARSSLFVALLCVLLAEGCTQREPTPKERGWLRLGDGQRANVLLITVDTLRADHVSCYGTRFGELTPNLARFAKDATVFTAAATAAPSTLPALASLHTGLYPGRHNVRTNLVQLEGSRLIAETLRLNGYTTAAFYGNSLLDRKSGFVRGFDKYVSFVAASGPADVQGAELAREWLGAKPQAPWFLWVHFMDPHGPYDSAPSSWSETIDAKDPLPDRELPISPTNYGLNVLPKFQKLPGLTRASEYRRRYSGEIRSTDEQIGRVLAAVDELGLQGTTLVVFTADHGESLGEHECYFRHGWFPYEDNVHVPLLVRLPGRMFAPPRIDDPVSLVDVVPTLLAALDLPAFEPLDGRDIAGLLGGASLPEAPVFSVTAYFNQMTMIRKGKWKLVHTPPPPAPFAGDPWAGFYRPAEQFELYDVDEDPNETRDLYSAEPQRAAALWAELARWRAAHKIPIGQRPAPKLDEDLRKRLEALGYGAQ